MSATVDLNEADVFGALRAWMLGILPPGAEVIKTQDNRVPMPARGTTFATLNNVHQRRLSTNQPSWDSTNGMDMMPTEYQIQIDAYGPDAGEWAQMLMSLSRAADVNDNWPAGVRMLYIDDGIQLPMIAGEHQFEARWKLQAFIQYNPTTTRPMPTMTQAQVGLREIDTTFTP